MATRSGVQPDFPEDDDLVLIADDGEIYWIPKDQYTDSVFRVPQEGRLADQIIQLSKQGVLLADVPSTSRPGVGAACYLVNLQAIRRQSPKSTDSSPSQPEEPEAEEQPLRAEGGAEASEGLPS